MVPRPPPSTAFAVAFRGGPNTASDSTLAANTAHAVVHLSAPCTQAATLVRCPAARVALAVAGDAARCLELVVTGVRLDQRSWQCGIPLLSPQFHSQQNLAMTVRMTVTF